jgi:hypothetical protein
MSLGSILGGIAKVAVGGIIGGPVGALGAAATLVPKPKAGPVAYAPTFVNSASPPPPAYPIQVSNPLTGTPIIQLGQPTYPTFGPMLPTTPSGPAYAPATMARTHPNKSTYVTRGGGTSRWPAGLQLHPKGTVQVTNRRMNAGNGRAAKHAVRRLVAFYRLSNQVAKQLRKAASRAGIHRGTRGRPRQLGRGGVEVVNVE